MFLSKKNSILIFSILFILIGVFLRTYQLNFDSYWLDEMISYWVADPNISFDNQMRINLIKNKLEIKEIPIKTIYGNERSSMHIIYALKFFFETILKRFN